MALVRFIVKNKGKCLGLYQAVDEFCPRDDPRRNHKPDGSWLPRRGQDFPGAISFWKKQGWKKYLESGLFDWHISVIQGELWVYVLPDIDTPFYEDQYQLICSPEVLTHWLPEKVSRELLYSWVDEV